MKSIAQLNEDINALATTRLDSDFSFESVEWNYGIKIISKIDLIAVQDIVTEGVTIIYSEMI
jgi:hypothetical protein